MNKREAPKSENFPVTDQKDQYKKKRVLFILPVRKMKNAKH